MLEALRDGRAAHRVTGAHLARALDDLLDSAQGVTRTLLGVGVDPPPCPRARRRRCPDGSAGWPTGPFRDAAATPDPGRGVPLGHEPGNRENFLGRVFPAVTQRAQLSSVSRGRLGVSGVPGHN